MGITSSSRNIANQLISPKEARALAGPDRWNTLEQTFRNLTHIQQKQQGWPTPATTIPFSTFNSHFFPPGLPYDLSKRIFASLTTPNQTLLTFPAFATALTVMRLGTPSHKVALLFTIYDLDKVGFITPDMIQRFMNVIWSKER